jgi:DNA-binding Lrp family transcriptional regulator
MNRTYLLPVVVQTSEITMERIVLTKVDLNILTILAKYSRKSFSGIGSLVGLTTKSVKARVK